ncbi:hypothetical protein JJT62_18585 [Methylocystis sp. Sn-Cys]|nr:hypothetical protein [Methylocystis sp. Sn-Cys]
MNHSQIASGEMKSAAKGAFRARLQIRAHIRRLLGASARMTMMLGLPRMISGALTIISVRCCVICAEKSASLRRLKVALKDTPVMASAAKQAPTARTLKSRARLRALMQIAQIDANARTLIGNHPSGPAAARPCAKAASGAPAASVTASISFRMLAPI